MVARAIRFCQFSRCGKQIMRPLGGKDSGKYCNRKCYRDAVDAGEQRFKGGLRGIEWQLISWFADWESQRPSCISCLHCGNKTNDVLYCSTACAKKHRYWQERPSACQQCGTSIAGLRFQSRGLCVACRADRTREKRRKERRKQKAKVGNYRKRCRHYGVAYDATVTRVLVFERDNFVCGLCGTKCLARFKWKGSTPHPLSPTIDHIIALAMRTKGHTWDNVQCACWQCNVAKGKAAKGQLRLVWQ